MKFAEHLGAHITPEWRKQYIQYEEMKAMLYESIQEAPSSEVVEPEVLTRYFAKFDETFFTFCEKGKNLSRRAARSLYPKYDLTQMTFTFSFFQSSPK